MALGNMMQNPNHQSSCFHVEHGTRYMGNENWMDNLLTRRIMINIAYLQC